MSFIETPRFPDDISYGSRGGPVFKTAVSQFDSGHEQRAIQWAYPLHEYDVSYGIRTDQSVYTLLDFFMSMYGAAHGFRYKDWADYKSCTPASTTTPFNCSIGTGDASTTVFQIKKTYTNGSLNMDRPIKKPVSATVSVAVNGFEKTVTTDYTVSYASGTITFVSAPNNGEAITAGFQFDVPCRFESDIFTNSIEAYNMNNVDARVIEIRVGS